MHIITSCLGHLTVCIALSFYMLVSPEIAAKQEVYIGASEVSITPDRPVPLEGSFTLRISDGIQSPIVASIIIIESRQDNKVSERSVMVSADLVHLPM